MLITYIFTRTTSQSQEYNTSSKGATNVTDILSNIEGNLITSISDVKYEVINLKKIIIKNLQGGNGMLPNKVTKLEELKT